MFINRCNVLGLNIGFTIKNKILMERPNFQSAFQSCDLAPFLFASAIPPCALAVILLPILLSMVLFQSALYAVGLNLLTCLRPVDRFVLTSILVAVATA